MFPENLRHRLRRTRRVPEGPGTVDLLTLALPHHQHPPRIQPRPQHLYPKRGAALSCARAAGISDELLGTELPVRPAHPPHSHLHCSPARAHRRPGHPGQGRPTPPGSAEPRGTVRQSWGHAHRLVPSEPATGAGAFRHRGGRHEIFPACWRMSTNASGVKPSDWGMQGCVGERDGG